MIGVDGSLVTSHCDKSEFTRNSVLDEGVTIEDLNSKVFEKIKRNSARRRKSLARARKSARF